MASFLRTRAALSFTAILAGCGGASSPDSSEDVASFASAVGTLKVAPPSGMTH